MTVAHQRKKQPEQVRRALLDCVAKLAAEQGPAALTIQAVAEAAGVTKGGLLHHFASKQVLLEALIADLLERMDRDIDRHMAEDPERHGRFTRAYVRTCFADRALGDGSPWAALAVTMISEPGLRSLWAQWLERRLAAHRETDDTPILAIVRLATDGVWLDDMITRDSGHRRDIGGLEGDLLGLAGVAAGRENR